MYLKKVVLAEFSNYKIILKTNDIRYVLMLK